MPITTCITNVDAVSSSGFPSTPPTPSFDRTPSVSASLSPFSPSTVTVNHTPIQPSSIKIDAPNITVIEVKSLNMENKGDNSQTVTVQILVAIVIGTVVLALATLIWLAMVHRRLNRHVRSCSIAKRVDSYDPEILPMGCYRPESVPTRAPIQRHRSRMTLSSRLYDLIRASPPNHRMLIVPSNSRISLTSREEEGEEGGDILLIGAPPSTPVSREQQQQRELPLRVSKVPSVKVPPPVLRNVSSVTQLRYQHRYQAPLTMGGTGSNAQPPPYSQLAR